MTLEDEIAKGMIKKGMIGDLVDSSQEEAKMKMPSEMGKFKLISLLGEGGLGKVYLAQDTILKRKVALKVLTHASEQDIKRFQREAKLAARLNHPNIVQLYDAGIINNTYYMSMQYIEGESLDKKSLDLKSALLIMRDIALAVEYAHRKAVIHRDIKPSNILIDKDGRPYLTDFGIAKQIMIEKDTLSRTGMVIGTPSFMSPEQARGEVRGLDETLDVYGLGATFYALVTGKEPFSGQSLYEIITKVISEMPREPRMIKKEIPKEIEAIIMKAMAKEKHERYSNAKAIADDIERFLKGEPIRATKYSIIKGVTQRIKRYKNRILVAGIMVIVLLLTFMILRLGSELKKERRIHALLKETAHLINKFDTFLSSPNPFDITSKYYILDDAIKNAKDAIKLKENLSEGYYEVARALIRKNRIKDAIKWLNKAIRIEPKGTYYYERGKIYLRLYLDEIFGGTGTLTERVFSPCMRELKEKIENDLKMVRGLNKMESEISQAIFLFCTKDLKKALKILDTAEQELIRINDIKLLPEVYHLKALIRCNQKRYSDAIKLLKEAIRFQGNRELFYLNCARIYTVKALFLLFNKRSPEDDITQAITMSKIALKINPHDYLAYYQLGIIYLVKSMYLSSIGKEFMTELSYVIRNLKKSLELNPEYLYAYNLLISSIYRRAKNLILKEMDPLEVIACGIRYTEDALKLAPYDLSFYIYKARLYMLKGQWFLEKKKDYKKEFEIVVKILTDALVIQVGSPEDSRRAVIYKLRGDAYHKLGYKEEAKRDWQRAKKLAPGFEDPF